MRRLPLSFGCRPGLAVYRCTVLVSVARRTSIRSRPAQLFVSACSVSEYQVSTGSVQNDCAGCYGADTWISRAPASPWKIDVGTPW